MLFSKNPDLHLPKLWPAYFSKSKGCHIWGLDEKRYIDFHLMGVGTNTLGYANKELEKNIIRNLSNGNMTTLNSIDEIELAEKLLHIHSWAEMARFTRTGVRQIQLLSELQELIPTKTISLFVVIMDGTIGIYHQIYKIQKI